MSDLTEFLLARIADEEDLARDAASEGSPPRTGWQLWTSKVYTTPGGEVLGPRGTVEAHSSRILAECDAKRRIVERHGSHWVGSEDNRSCDEDNWEYPCPTLRLLALPHDAHPDYDESWRP